MDKEDFAKVFFVELASRGIGHQSISQRHFKLVKSNMGTIL